MLCPCLPIKEAHEMRLPAPFGEQSPCCKNALLRQFQEHLTQYATCGGSDPITRQITGCQKVYWHDGKVWLRVPADLVERLKVLI